MGEPLINSIMPVATSLHVPYQA